VWIIISAKIILQRKYLEDVVTVFID
jgi:hypothetical protein